jgi:hypothetical protein
MMRVRIRISLPSASGSGSAFQMIFSADNRLFTYGLFTQKKKKNTVHIRVSKRGGKKKVRFIIGHRMCWLRSCFSIPCPRESGKEKGLLTVSDKERDRLRDRPF